eukprot:12473-Heterococcus_DN1.PRE.1
MRAATVPSSSYDTVVRSVQVVPASTSVHVCTTPHDERQQFQPLTCTRAMLSRNLELTVSVAVLTMLEAEPDCHDVFDFEFEKRYFGPKRRNIPLQELQLMMF